MKRMNIYTHVVPINDSWKVHIRLKVLKILLQLPHLVLSVGEVLNPDNERSSNVHIGIGNIKDEVVPLTPDVFPLQPPLLADQAVVRQAQHSRSCLLIVPLQVHGQPGLVDQTFPLPPPERSVSPVSPVHHGELVSVAVQTKDQTIQTAIISMVR